MKKKSLKQFNKLKLKGIVISKKKGVIVMQMRKQFSWANFIILTLLFNVFGGLCYIAYYVTKREGEVLTFTLRPK